MRVEFSELAVAGIARELPDPSRQQSCFVHLRFFLRRDHDVHSEVCPAFDDRTLYLYAFGSRWRVLYEVDGADVMVWSFTSRR